MYPYGLWTPYGPYTMYVAVCSLKYMKMWDKCKILHLFAVALRLFVLTADCSAPWLVLSHTPLRTCLHSRVIYITLVSSDVYCYSAYRVRPRTRLGNAVVRAHTGWYARFRYFMACKVILTCGHSRCFREFIYLKNVRMHKYVLLPWLYLYCKLGGNK